MARHISSPGSRLGGALLVAALMLAPVATSSAAPSTDAAHEAPAALAQDDAAPASTSTLATERDADTAEVTPPHVAPHSERRALRALVPILLLLMLAAGLLLVELRLRRARRRGRPTHAIRAISLPAPRAHGGSAHGEGLAHAAAGHGGVAAASTAEVTAQTSLAVLAGLVGELHDEHDHADALARRPGEDALDLGTAAMACPECRRSYEMGTRFCPFDGELLHATELDARGEHDPESALEDHVMVCPRCAAEYEPGAIYCAIDHARLVLRSPDAETPDRLGRAPMVVCTRCAREFRVGQSHCPDCGDQGELRLLHGRTTFGTWVDAPPYSRICPDCGSRYSEELGFCCHDGATLVHLN